MADDPRAWEAVGFALRGDATRLGEVTVRFVPGDGGIVGWSLHGLRTATLDGLVTSAAPSGAAEPAVPPPHPNGVVGVDHVVAVTPDLDRTVAALDAAGLDRRRIRDAGGGLRQAFYAVGPALLEVAGDVQPERPRDAAFWGLTCVVADLDATKAALGDRMGAVKDAVQPGRRIATVRPAPGLGTALAFMTPRVEP